MVPAAGSKTMLCLPIVLNEVHVHISTTEDVLAGQTNPTLLEVLASSISKSVHILEIQVMVQDSYTQGLIV